ncbi:MAG: tRNA 2-selenouridine(34) synthase MnmH [Pseudomonadota bacterium]
MPAPNETADYRALFLSHTPLLDLRAPAEYSRGAFPASLNLPLMTDDERAQVGIRYKQAGQRAAIELGHKLVSGACRSQRLQRWVEFARRFPEGYLYCWRGGLRSLTVQQWLAAEGIQYPRVKGGYKALRRFLLDELASSLSEVRLVLVCGRTGAGKTRVIERVGRSVDLEGLANHRGSSFGQRKTPQPSQIEFENGLSIALMRLLETGSGKILIEDEGRLIGRLALPEQLRHAMTAAPLVLLEQTLEQRVQTVLEDYVIDLAEQYDLAHGPDGSVLHEQKLQQDLSRIQRRLGGERYRCASDMMRDAFDRQRQGGSNESHRAWIGYLLEHYYDPMYDHQLKERQGKCLFRGDRQAVVRWAREFL